MPILSCGKNKIYTEESIQVHGQSLSSDVDQAVLHGKSSNEGLGLWKEAGKLHAFL